MNKENVFIVSTLLVALLPWVVFCTARDFPSVAIGVLIFWAVFLLGVYPVILDAFDWLHKEVRNQSPFSKEFNKGEEKT